MSGSLDPQQAREMLERAGQLGAASRSGAGWPQIALLLGLGGISSMFMVALYLVWLPMAIMGLWLLILTATMLAFTRSTKVGFSRRWNRIILTWGLVWVFSMVGGTVWWEGQLWFTLVSVLLLTAITTWGAWREARQ